MFPHVKVTWWGRIGRVVVCSEAHILLGLLIHCEGNYVILIAFYQTNHPFYIFYSKDGAMSETTVYCVEMV